MYDIGDILLKLVLAIVAGGLIGFEREYHGKTAGAAHDHFHLSWGYGIHTAFGADERHWQSRADRNSHCQWRRVPGCQCNSAWRRNDTVSWVLEAHGHQDAHKRLIRQLIADEQVSKVSVSP